MQKIKSFDQIPLKNPAYEDVWFASFEAPDPHVPGHRLYVPKEHTPNSMAAAFNAAFNLGTMMQQTKVYKAFHVCLDQGEEAGQTIGWPIIHLLPVTEATTCCHTATEAANMRTALLAILVNLDPNENNPAWTTAYQALGGKFENGIPIDHKMLLNEAIPNLTNK